jgi:meso-butanediol dehydrogenase/(S,S)-butanediol dehydrogenase/diacetyl reductase
MPDLNGRVCVVTGAARGIGRGIAEQLVQEGAKVCLADLNVEEADGAASEINARGGECLAAECDVTSHSSIAGVVDSVVAKWGRLDVMVNNAGIAGRYGPLLGETQSDFDTVMAVNARGALFGIQVAVGQFQRQGDGGKIINVSSMAGKEGFPLQVGYSASKFAVVALTQVAAKEFAAEGIRVNVICPGITETDMWDVIDRDSRALGHTEKEGELLEVYSKQVPLGRAGTPTDQGRAVVFLASSDSDFITGQAINVNGGMLVH